MAVIWERIGGANMTIKERAVYIVEEIKDFCEISFDREQDVIRAVTCALYEIEMKRGEEECRK